MKVLLCLLMVIHASLQACLDPDHQASVQIQNFECPIYVHPPSCDQTRQETYECTCVKQPNYGPGIYNTATYLGVDQKGPNNLYNTGTYLGVDQKGPNNLYNTGTYLGVDQKCPENFYNTGTYSGPHYPQTGVERKFCLKDVKKSCPRTVELDTTLIYGSPQNHQNRQCEFKYASYF